MEELVARPSSGTDESESDGDERGKKKKSGESALFSPPSAFPEGAFSIHGSDVSYSDRVQALGLKLLR